MADRFWVGGTASWDGTAGTKWAASSGGTGGETVPTSADDVFFDSLSTGTVTIAAGNTGAKSINCTGFTGTLTGSAAISVNGSVTLSAGMTYTHTGTVTFIGTGTLITAGKTFSGVTVSGAGITLTLGDALNTGGRALTVTEGTFATANYNVTPGDFNSTGSLTRAIQLGSSTITFAGSAPFNISGSGLTFNAGTSQINHTASAGSLNASISLTFYNYSFTSTSTGTRSISTAQTFNNLTLVASATGLSQLSLGGNQTVNGTFTCAGSSALARGFIRSSTIGTARTVTAAVISANDCDFRDITLAGAAAGASPTRAGDCGGNSGITFPAPKTVYRVGTNTSWPGSSSWALTSGGVGSDNNFPLAQDTAVINNDTALTGTLDHNQVYSISAVDCSTRTTGITINHPSIQDRYGSYILGSGVIVSGIGQQNFAGRGTMDFTAAGQTITFTVGPNAATGTLRLGGPYTSNLDISVTSGTFDANNNNVTIRSLSAAGSGTKTIALGSGLWTVTSTWNASGTGTTVSPSTATINMTSASAKTFLGGGYSWPTLNQGGAGVLTIAQSNTFANITNTVQPATVRLTAGTTQTVSAFSLSGTAGNLITLDTTVAGTRATLSSPSGTVSVSYVSIKDSNVTDGATWEAYTTNGNVDGGNNTGWLFSSAPVVVPGTGVYSPTGAIRVIKNDTSVSRGLYAADGSLRITVVTGSSYTGRYAADGALNVVDVSGVSISTYGGLYHPCGALRGRTAPDTFSGLQAPDGSYYLRGLFSPLNLFSNGEVGGWYDPSDLTTLFQDAAGTTPVTAVEQPVGRVLDKSGRNNHLSQSTSTARPVLSARVNLLTRTEEFDNAAWTKTNVTVSQIAGAVWEVNEGTATGNHLVSQVLPQGTTAFGVAIDVRAGNASPWVRLTSRSSFVTNYLDFNLSTLQQIDENGTTTAFTNPTWSVTPLSDGWYRLQIRCDGVVNEAGARPLALAILDSSRNLSHTGTSRTIQIRYPQIETGNKNSSYQRVGAATDYDTTGFPLYLKFDGTDDFLVSSTINPGSVDKAQVFAGVRKVSESNYALIAETSADPNSNAGSLGLWNSTVGTYTTGAYGTVLNGSAVIAGTTAQNYTAPITNVVDALFDIGASTLADEAKLRVNGGNVSFANTSGADAGTANFGNHALYVGRRGGSSFPANMQLYSLILRFSATNMDAATIAATETWVNSKTRAY